MSENKTTKLITAGRDKKWTNGVVNPPVQRASTVVFNSVEEKRKATINRANKTLFYGRRGTNTHFAFQDAMVEVEGGAGCALYPCGTAAISNAILSFVETGDHILMVDTCYEPTRDFCDTIMKKMGVETTYYEPTIGEGIQDLIKPNTKVLFTESPGSVTMEVQDIPTLARIAHEHDIIVMLDNTWAAGVNFSPFDFGVDISIQAATKYIVGHSDVMLGTAVANEKCWDQLREQSYLMGQCVSPDDAYLGLRGIRTLDVRLRQHAESSLKVAKWLETRPEVDHVRHPALESCPGHEFFKRDFTGGNGLFSFVLKNSNTKATTALLDGMTHFSMGYSWGGFESLILANEPSSFNSLRTVANPNFEGTLIRVHIGLEDVDDLIADLEAGLERYNALV
ncbi:cystathionine beta-lyase/L-cysteine desulfhydrase/alanine racemase [Vibrio crassostreae]|uniref:cystathionine beta-lyase n=1 Tax=Vibrio crassostreae TaxID=246167 RepID=UPI001B30B5F3|nr:cystathionine beta-lyase [Vibrio crassostreae]CAK2870158.1 cystathionine beta-lyase/L-cysteine desulfhydrase/alanine racemase [Vibrio crassostreae]CAK3371001.1 cystathionine beta-lyase/L-cysteine desulfhydrase/alanine racemase [Vibrio crassostreae]CAK3377249.1 cystathionine beta-lyase/L-cysteine desulfhydrase/alanine racemase [Vibrio crassostreae]CAK3393568.1 cystathionine beta-lyase/L-cysteine desulfhydrase/alanine racemase [Vibrio crassostreae]CAK3408693.1 cystathionine beta-lyase/L-cyste